MKRNIYVVRNIEIKRDSNTLKLDNSKIPLSIVKNLFVIGNGKVSKSAQNLLLKNGKTIFYLSGRYQLLGILSPTFYSSDYKVRLKQYSRGRDLELSKYIVKSKIEAIERFVGRSLYRHIKKLEDCKSLNEILGVEGIVSTYMFSKLKKELEAYGIFDFKKREYRPVKDRVNGVLSFLYTLYYSYLFAEIVSEGMDPYIGFLHIKRGRHAAFVSDMMEEARVELTELSIEILSEVYNDGFDGLYLTNDARRILLNKFDEFVQWYENSLFDGFKELL